MTGSNSSVSSQQPRPSFQLDQRPTINTNNANRTSCCVTSWHTCLNFLGLNNRTGRQPQINSSVQVPAANVENLQRAPLPSTTTLSSQVIEDRGDLRDNSNQQGRQVASNIDWEVPQNTDVQSSTQEAKLPESEEQVLFNTSEGGEFNMTQHEGKFGQDTSRFDPQEGSSDSFPFEMPGETEEERIPEHLYQPMLSEHPEPAEAGQYILPPRWQLVPRSAFPTPTGEENIARQQHSRLLNLPAIVTDQPSTRINPEPRLRLRPSGHWPGRPPMPTPTTSGAQINTPLGAFPNTGTTNPGIPERQLADVPEEASTESNATDDYRSN